MKKPTKVFCLFDYNAFTGFSTVSKNLKHELKKHFGSDLQLDICAINYFGEPYTEEDGTYVVSALKSATKKDDFGRFGFLKILKESNDYDGIFILQDLGVIVPIIEVLKHIKDEKRRENKKQFKSIFYFPIDFGLVKKLTDNLEFFDCLVTYTEYGREQLLKFRPELRGKIKVVPHGNNSKHFYPIEKTDIQSFRDEYFGKNCNKVIVTNVNRNQPRKDIPTTIFSFIRARERWKEMGMDRELFLYLHMNAKDPMGWDLDAIMLQTDLVEGVDYKILEQELADKGASVEMLNNIYNASDIYLTTTLGEGWGLTLTEAMATKTPIICPLSTSFIEITNNGKNVYPIERLLPYCSNFDNVIRQQSEITDTSETIIHVALGLCGQLEDLNFTENLNKRLENGYKWCKSLEWQDVCKKWIDYFKETY